MRRGRRRGQPLRLEPGGLGLPALGALRFLALLRRLDLDAPRHERGLALAPLLLVPGRILGLHHAARKTRACPESRCTIVNSRCAATNSSTAAFAPGQVVKP